MIFDSIIGIVKTLTDRLVPDRNKKQDQDHELLTKQADASIELEKSGKWYMWRNLLGYILVINISILVGNFIMTTINTGHVDVEVLFLLIKLISAYFGVSY